MRKVEKAYRWRGMKVTHLPKRKRVNPILTERRKKINAERRKVRKNETINNWESRVRKYKLMSEEKIQKKIDQKKICVRRRKELTKSKEKRRIILNTFIRPFIRDKDYDYLKWYGAIVNYFCIKYAVSKNDVEIMFMLYNNQIFNKERFDNVCILINGNVGKYWSFFIKEGLLTKVNQKITNKDQTITTKYTDVYMLSEKASIFVGQIYIHLTKIKKFYINHRKPELNLYPKGALELILEMNAETEEFLTGLKEQLRIKDIKLDE